MYYQQENDQSVGPNGMVVLNRAMIKGIRPILTLNQEINWTIKVEIFILIPANAGEVPAISTILRSSLMLGASDGKAIYY